VAAIGTPDESLGTASSAPSGTAAASASRLQSVVSDMVVLPTFVAIILY
jgi:hypothetical protein